MLSHPQREALPGQGGVSHGLCLTEPLCFRYRVVVEGERGNRPHIYSLEQLLQEAVCAACPPCSCPVLGWGRLAGISFLLQLQGCPGPGMPPWSVWVELPLVQSLPHGQAPPLAAGTSPVFQQGWSCEHTAGHSPAGKLSLAFSRAALLPARCGGMVCAGARVVSNCLPLALSRSSM